MKNKQGAYKESFTTAMNSVGNSVNHLTFLRAFKRPSKKSVMLNHTSYFYVIWENPTSYM